MAELIARHVATQVEQRLWELYALGDDDYGSTRCVASATRDKLDESVDRRGVNWLLGHEDGVCATSESAPCGDPARVSPHHFHNGNAVMRRGGGLDAVERFGDDVCSSIKAEAAFGPPDVVVHCLGDRNHSGAALGESRSDGEGVVTTNDNERIEPQALD